MKFKNFRNYEVLNLKPLVSCIDAEADKDYKGAEVFIERTDMETMIIFCKPLSQYIKNTVKEIIVAKELEKAGVA